MRGSQVLPRQEFRPLTHDVTMVAPPPILVALFLAARIFFLATSHESFSKWSWKRQAL
jgi:hypothetical protein